MLQFFAILFFIVSSFLSPLINAEEPVSLTFNIISHSLQNGAGKEVDVLILKGELEKLGHQVNLFDYYKVDAVNPADINIFLAQFKSTWFSKARQNWFIPNAECCDATLEELQKFDLILCKTEECLKIFTPLNKNCYYLGFTSIDRYQPSTSKKFSKLLHVAGKSRMKGTGQILKAWRDEPGLPNLIMTKHSYIPPITKVPRNVKLVVKRVPSPTLLKWQNECGIHLCPSKTEGFGHYIMEAMSTGAVIVTTDAPPMNEFIKDKRCLVNYSSTGKKKFATIYNVDSYALAKTVRALQQLSNEELQTIGQFNRQEYLRRSVEFKHNLENLINRTVQTF